MSIFQPVTVITGASVGIGAALARAFAARGHEIALIARREAQLATLADEIAAEHRKRPHVLPIDLARADAPARIAHELLGRGLEPAYVVNNAGFGLLGPAAELDRNEQLAMIDLNVRVVTDLSLRWIESVTRHRGGILNVASVAAFMPGPGMAVYYASKAYVLSFSEALHHEMKPKGVTVTALCPGPVDTEFQDRAGIGAGYFPRILTRSAGRVAEEGVEGLLKGERVVVPAFANRVVTWLPRLLPRGFMMAVIGRGQTKRRKPKEPERWQRRPPAPPAP